MLSIDTYLREIRIKTPIPSDSYLAKIPAIAQLMQGELLSFPEKVTFFVGENGMGKSTLIEAIAIAMKFNPEGGTMNFSFSTESTHSELHRYLSVCKGKHHKDGFFLRAESFYNVASYIDETDRTSVMGNPIINSYGGVSLHHQSHGESFMTLVEKRFSGQGLYILDEPEAALSPARLLHLLCHIRRLEKCGSQFIISTHSPILLAYPGACIYLLSENGICRTDYKDTPHYRITKSFLDCPERTFSYLFEDN
ncbi:MAG: AAA family ATPase [Clostridia bacterium]|nr:AAA family ATPase [Clostridia bacterium]